MDTKTKKLIVILGITNIVLLLIAVVLFFLSRDRLSPSGSSSKNIEISYWGLWEADEVMHPMIEKYEALNPGIKILYSQQAYTDYEQRVYARLEQAKTTGEPAPDVIRIYNTWLPKYQKYLQPLPSSVMDKTTYSNEFYPTALDDFTGTDDKIYAIPLHIDGLLIIYNKSLLKEAGYLEPAKDWDSFMEMAQVLTTRDSTGKIVKSGLAIGTSKNILHSVDIFSYFLLQNRVQVMNKTRDQVNLNNSRAISALETYTSFVQDEDATWGIYLPNDLTKFQNGELAMMFGNIARAMEIMEEAPNIDFGLAQLPRLPNNEETYYSSYWADTVTTSSQHPEEAWRFIEWLSQPEQQRRLFQNATKTRPIGPPYARVSMNQELLDNPYTKAVGIMAPYMKSWQMGEQFFVEDLIKENITKIVESGTSAEATMMNLEKQINNRLAVTNTY